MRQKNNRWHSSRYALTRYLVVFRQFSDQKCTIPIGPAYTHHYGSYRRARTEARTLKYADGNKWYYTRGIHIEKVEIEFWRDEQEYQH